MALTKEDLQAIEQLFDKKMDEKLEPIKEQLDEMQGSLEEVRSTTNALVAWADNVSVVTQIKFPVEKRVNNG